MLAAVSNFSIIAAAQAAAGCLGKLLAFVFVPSDAPPAGCAEDLGSKAAAALLLVGLRPTSLTEWLLSNSQQSTSAASSLAGHVELLHVEVRAAYRRRGYARALVRSV